MRWFRKISIRQKLTWVIMVTSSATLLFACAGFVLYDFFTYRAEMKHDLSSVAEIVGANSTAALSFTDRKSAEETLSSLSDKPHIIAACIYTTRGTIFARYLRKGAKEAVEWPRREPDGDRIENGHLELFHRIVFHGETLGTVYLRSDLQQVHARLTQYGKIVYFVFLVSTLAAFFLAAVMQRLVSRPILQLAETAKHVSENKDYAVRAAKRSEDEVGTLIDSFNEMLRQIQDRDAALQRSEKHFRSLIENASDIITLVDSDHRVRYQSPSAERILGLAPEELLGRLALDYVHEDDVRLVLNELGQVAQTTGATASFEFRFCRKDGSWIYLECKAKNLCDDPTIGGIILNSRDITERKHAEQQLQAFANSLERSNRELQDFAYVASHDLQEPLRKIQAFGDRLKSKCAEAIGEQGRDYLDRMQDAARRMQTLITDLLQFSRITTKAQPFVPVDLNQVAREVMSDLEVRIEQNKARVEIGDLPKIEADPLQMRQLFQNVVGNALKFQRENVPPVIQIRSRGLDGGHPPGNHGSDHKDFCQIEVQDNGIGFDEKYVDRIFVIFQRLHGRGHYEGTGVGLAICRKIVDRHGGQITARSKPGEGATFLVTLPLRQNQGEKS